MILTAGVTLMPARPTALREHIQRMELHGNACACLQIFRLRRLLAQACCPCCKQHSPVMSCKESDKRQWT